jgi:hypothetical protein
MEWFANLIEWVKGQRSIDFVVTGALPVGTAAVDTAPLDADACYVQLSIAAIRIPQSRRFASKIYGVVHAFTKLARDASADVEMANVSAPQELANIDPANAYKVVSVDKIVMGPVAWRGGNLDIQIGLFSVVSSDLAGPFIDLVTTLATTAGASFVTAAAPFVPVIKQGMEFLGGSKNSSTLEVGISRTLMNPSTGYFAILGIDKTKFDVTGLSVASSDRRLQRGTQPIDDAPYIVYQIFKTQQRPDFGNIPELAQGYQDLAKAVRSGIEIDARDSLKTFTRLVITSPDLIPSDAKRLRDKASALVDTAFPGGPSGKRETAIPATLADIGLYE